jgi:glutathione peroxidase
MKGYMFTVSLLIILMGCGSNKSTTANKASSSNLPEMKEYSIESINGFGTLNLEDYRGKYLLLVNVASKCGYTPQYDALQELYEKNGDKLMVIGFPCNQFMGQEPGTEEEIVSFCKKNYGVTFPITEKIEVKGDGQHEIYQWLTSKSENGLGDFKVSWNFNKFLISPKGKLLGHFPSSVSPLDESITTLLK